MPRVREDDVDFLMEEQRQIETEVESASENCIYDTDQENCFGYQRDDVDLKYESKGYFKCDNFKLLDSLEAEKLYKLEQEGIRPGLVPIHMLPTLQGINIYYEGTCKHCSHTYCPDYKRDPVLENKKAMDSEFLSACEEFWD
ncbi:MAG: hypothetical protein HQK56_17120 [Deltaproteobacteria bacterium]|nr:hypothetical protein [Deltaproteobacteria bacterium]